jgi:hypothetical protein
MPQDQAFRERVDRIGGLVQQLEAAADPAVRAAAKELVAAVMELHAAGIERVLEIVSRSGAAAPGILESFNRDALLSSLLILHGLHPEDLEKRVRRALEGVTGAEIVALEGGVLRLTVRHGMEAAAREALYGAAPDLAEIVIEKSGTADFVPLSALNGSRPEANR